MAGNGKKEIGLRKATTLHVHQASIMYISLRSLLNCNFTFCGGREHKTTIFFYLSCIRLSLKNSTPKKLPTFETLNEIKIYAR